MVQPEDSRLGLELELLKAMYPDQIDYNARSRDFKFSDASALLHLRLPGHYPDAGLPEVISAKNYFKDDVRDKMKAEIKSLGISEGEEVLDAIIASFQDMITTIDQTKSHAGAEKAENRIEAPPESHKTIIIWLHHLLALTKRKLALAPAASVSGCTKPGYPGIMVFTGPASAVNDHVNILKAENWQAFQVRYEERESWEFAHSPGVREVETMAEIVKVIEMGTNGTQRKEEFLKAAGIK